MIHVTIPWKKHAKQRPRSGRGHTYTPTATKQAEKIVADNFRAAVGPDYVPTPNPIGVSITLRKDELDISVFNYTTDHAKALNGDIDNYAKTVLDALNGVAWVDDKQICRLFVVKA